MPPSNPAIRDLRIDRPPEDERPRRTWLLVFAVAIVAAAGAAAWMLRPRAVEVRTAAVRAPATQSAAERTVLNASGYVTARRAATVSSKVTGKVVDVLVEEGMAVAEGQILAHLDDTNLRAGFDLARAQVAAARAALAEIRVRTGEAEQERQRQASLIRASVSSQADYDHAEAAAAAYKARLGQQEAEVAVAESSLAVCRQQLDDTVIRSPFAGVVTTKDAQPGEMISPVSAGGGYTRTGICTVVDMESLEIEIDVNESYINRVQPAQPVEATLDAYPEWRIPCRVIAIIPTADRQKSTVKVRVGFVKLDPRILPEMGVKVAFREAAAAGAPPARSLRVPRAAVRQQDGRDAVFVVQGGRVERRAVAVAASTSEEAEIAAGLAEGERVVVSGPASLADGAAVKEANP